jgi:hypothetical protein
MECGDEHAGAKKAIRSSASFGCHASADHHIVLFAHGVCV